MKIEYEKLSRNILAWIGIIIGFSFLYRGLFMSIGNDDMKLDLICGILLLREGFDLLKTQTITINTNIKNL